LKNVPLNLNKLVKLLTNFYSFSGSSSPVTLESTRNSSGDEIANVNFFLQRGKTSAFDRHEIRLRVGVSSLAVRFGTLSYGHIVHAVQNIVHSCINSTTDRRGHLAHLHRRRNPYPNPSLVLGGVCRSATAALLMYVSLGAYTLTLTLTQP